MATRKSPGHKQAERQDAPDAPQTMWDRLVEPLRLANEERRQWLEEHGSRGDRVVTTGLVMVAVILTIQYYYLTSADLVPLTWINVESFEIVRGIMWSTGHLFLYLVIPCICVWSLGGRLRDYGLKVRGAFSYWWVYVGMYLVMLPVIVLVSQRPAFQHTYPFYQLAPNEPLWPRFIVWEILYAAQFVALEFFFRGFMLHGTKRQFGAYAILVMTIPYCMIHFQKPMPETLGAIGAGLILGYMSLKTRSIWMGAALHIAIAWTMDALAIMGR